MFNRDPHVRPQEPPAHEPVAPGRFDAGYPGVRVTWFGHSSTLVEIEGHRVLTDPVWSDRAGPVTWAGPTRWFPRPITLDALPPLDAVVISHDHYDHMDYKTVLGLKDSGVLFVVPLGLGAHLAEWGVADAQIVELDWWEKARVKALDIVCTPARHASGRGVFDKDMTLGSGYAMIGASHRVYYSGDTGLFPAMRDIGEQYGPFDLTMIEIGQYNQAWPDWHIGPEQAVKAHRWVNGKLFLPVHWGLFELASHGWTEPIERAVAEAKKTEVAIVTPKPGQSVTTDAPPTPSRWWPELPYKTAEQDPIISTQVD
jgi:L-ascorbate metabolism protein UlaG (beta-lactamase superfamily)